MNKSTADIQALHAPRQNHIQALAAAHLIAADVLDKCTPIELYSVVSEHWDKCSPCAKAALMKHTNLAIRSHAMMIASVMDTLADSAVA